MLKRNMDEGFKEPIEEIRFYHIIFYVFLIWLALVIFANLTKGLVTSYAQKKIPMHVVNNCTDLQKFIGKDISGQENIKKCEIQINPDIVGICVYSMEYLNDNGIMWREFKGQLSEMPESFDKFLFKRIDPEKLENGHVLVFTKNEMRWLKLPIVPIYNDKSMVQKNRDPLMDIMGFNEFEGGGCIALEPSEKSILKLDM
ncbi:MAG: hypothetical protein J0L55_07570 [Caulobacterales bacterium]|nr:hypothetical protein [Caulobacterales bacterium]MCA0371471.1 hypothetical protein [Pseudomonadota bacterium]